MVVDVGVECEDVDGRQLMSLANGIVVEVVGGRDLDAAGTEFRVHIVVGNHRNLTAHQGQRQHLAHQVGIAFVLGADRNGDVTQHRLRPGGGHDQAARAIGEVVLNLPDVAVFFLADHFKV